ncbi:DUF2971 domain-containing protein [Thalassolituus oleivorans]|uniref:DUF2971 domain-containing protein n=1 Tax=Thalassolituus oleivorans TaxID=187493 RepID=UPI0024092BC4|nr:DUF2971 domain-containing protein [Thalassolituus oleivorans]MDF1640441.1 DUF2971 domain-containing protein [Thalassolituus oleivorans]
MKEEDIWSDTTGEKYLYRYRPANLFTLHEVMFQRLYFQTRDKLNDPAEMRINFQNLEKMDLGRKITLYMRALEKGGLNEATLRNELIEKWVKDWREAQASFISRFDAILNESEAKYRSLTESILKNGICCFSKKPLNPTMLAHYSNNDGVVLAFDRKKMLKSLKIENTGFFNVQYETDQTPIDLKSLIFHDLEPESSNKPKIDFLAMKYKDWEYESEVRLVSTDKGASSEILDNGVLAGLCFAPKSSETTREIFSKICSDNSIPVFECESINSYHYRAKLIVT